MADEARDPNVEPENYEPPQSARELLERYVAGERYFVRAFSAKAFDEFQNLFYADLPEANLRQASLSHFDFRHANLTGADLVGADLREANLEGAQRVVIDPRVENLRAIRCYEKAGFRKARRLPRHERHEGRWCDAWLMICEVGVA